MKEYDELVQLIVDTKEARGGSATPEELAGALMTSGYHKDPHPMPADRAVGFMVQAIRQPHNHEFLKPFVDIMAKKFLEEFTDSDIALEIQSSTPRMNFNTADQCAKDILSRFEGKVLRRDTVADDIAHALMAIAPPEDTNLKSQ